MQSLLCSQHGFQCTTCTKKTIENVDQAERSRAITQERLETFCMLSKERRFRLVSIVFAVDAVLSVGPVLSVDAEMRHPA
jgi:hypothetical protein